MSEQHTPGPWHVVMSADGYGQEPKPTRDIGAKSYSAVARSFGPTLSEQAANARLIADAPRLKRVNAAMYEALKAIAELVEDAKPGDPDDEVLYAIQGWAEPALASAEHQENESE